MRKVLLSILAVFVFCFILSGCAESELPQPELIEESVSDWKNTDDSKINPNAPPPPPK